MKTSAVAIVGTLLIVAVSNMGCAGTPAAAPSPSPAPSALAPSFVPPAPQPAVEAQIQGPRGLAFDSHGSLYVSECAWTYAAIEKIDPNGVMTRFAGTGTPGFSGDGGPATSAQLYCPAGIAVGPDGSVYFADHVNNRIRRVDATGVITTYAGSGPAGLGMGSFAGDGGPATEAALQEPWGVAFDQSGTLFIADRDNARVRQVDPDGVITTVAGHGAHGSGGDGGPATEAEICPPIGVAIDPSGNLVLPDACTSAIRIVDGNGIITTFANTHGADADTGSEGNAIFGSDGTMFVQSGARVFKVDSAGVATPIAGNGEVGVPADGSSALDSPLPLEIWGLAMDDRGGIYIADGATSVWRFDIDGIQRFAGRMAATPSPRPTAKLTPSPFG
ncbi:MAG: hypothetical protein QOJ81_2024 [Chloroflexota bacterium]|nr:hypothetical protein [Chloroflexota bacterium]